MSARRHRWSRSERSDGSETCVVCGVARYHVDGAPPVFNYEWPDGRKEARKVNSGYVPPCEPKEQS